MHGLTALSVAALMGLSNAWTYPSTAYVVASPLYGGGICLGTGIVALTRDVGSRQLLQRDERRSLPLEVVEFCPGYLAGTIPTIPDYLENCNSDASKVSSACSCVTYWATATSSAPGVLDPASETTTASSVEVSTSSAAPSSSSTAGPTSSVVETSSAGPTGASTSTYVHPSHTKTYGYTTSTVTETKTRTVTSCKPEVTNCPAHTTVETTVYTTVCPITETSQAPSGNATYYPPTTTKTYINPGTSKSAPSTTPSHVVESGAGKRVAEVAAVLLGAVAVALL